MWGCGKGMGGGRRGGGAQQRGCLSALHYYRELWLSGKWDEALCGLSQTAQPF